MIPIHNRKEEALNLLDYIKECYDTRDDLKDIRLTQLILNAIEHEKLVQFDGYLYNVESSFLLNRLISTYGPKLVPINFTQDITLAHPDLNFIEAGTTLYTTQELVYALSKLYPKETDTSIETTTKSHIFRTLTSDHVSKTPYSINKVVQSAIDNASNFKTHTKSSKYAVMLPKNVSPYVLEQLNWCLDEVKATQKPNV